MSELLNGVFGVIGSLFAAMGLLLVGAVVVIVGMLVLFVIHLRRRDRERDRWRTHPRRPLVPPDPRGQLVGRACVQCRAVCNTVIDSRWCEHCDQALHVECEAAHRATGTGQPYR